MTKDRYIYLKLGIILLLQMLILEIFKRYPKIFVLKLVIILSICFIIFAIGFLINHHLASIGYLLALITVLFFIAIIYLCFKYVDFCFNKIENTYLRLFTILILSPLILSFFISAVLSVFGISIDI